MSFFNENSFIDVFVGKNATGKSNLFEALIEIFHHIYKYDKKTFSPSFNYSIRYEIKDKEINIEWVAFPNRLQAIWELLQEYFFIHFIRKNWFKNT